MYFARTILVLLGAFVVGLIGYQIGVSQNLVAQIPAGAPAVPSYYWYGPHWFGFGFLGLLFPLLFLFFIFGLVRAAFWGGRGWGGYGHGYDARRARLEEIHRELHGERPAGATTTDRPADR